MNLPKNEQRALLALVEEHDENPRLISTLIVMAACNARAGHQQDAMLVALASLKRQGLVDMKGDAWWPTRDGFRAARMIKTGTVPAAPAPESLEEAPPVRPKSRDTLRTRQGAAPKPVTRPDPAAPAFDDPDSPEEPAADCHTPLAADLAIEGDGSGQALPPVEYPATVERIGPGPLAPDLVNRCAAMQMALLADARRRYEQGDVDAAGEIRWLQETGQQLLEAGGLSCA
ncbi:hypothetical protein [Halomonas lysinitropha]|uniref:Uncharacterized protein n=1 Tax=Halomonas lysinitropha TaxID=2607506 RepID=A0A5K1I4E5_9GAMM|nr:hypothetical protein [Halomonas lysinitropha]VVZ96484.1 hypothetical protein HALO32_02584 [Halomonas lysinitropha]